MLDFGERCGRFDFRRDQPVFGVVGEPVAALYRLRCRGKIGWSGITDCEEGDWYGLVRSSLYGEGERREIVPVKWGRVLTAHCHSVFHIE